MNPAIELEFIHTYKDFSHQRASEAKEMES